MSEEEFLAALSELQQQEEQRTAYVNRPLTWFEPPSNKTQIFFPAALP